MKKNYKQFFFKIAITNGIPKKIGPQALKQDHGS